MSANDIYIYNLKRGGGGGGGGISSKKRQIDSYRGQAKLCDQLKATDLRH